MVALLGGGRFRFLRALELDGWSLHPWFLDGTLGCCSGVGDSLGNVGP